MATLREKSQSAPAYTLVDLDSIEDDELRNDIILDASEGGGVYGILVVEEAVNGPARSPIYGVYNTGPHSERWTAAKEQLGLVGEEVGDEDIRAASVEASEAKAELLRRKATLAAGNEAAAIDAAENAEVEAIAGKATDAASKNKAPK